MKIPWASLEKQFQDALFEDRDIGIPAECPNLRLISLVRLEKPIYQKETGLIFQLEAVCRGIASDTAGSINPNSDSDMPPVCHRCIFNGDNTVRFFTLHSTGRLSCTSSFKVTQKSP